jgi:hypothetical protein
MYVNKQSKYLKQQQCKHKDDIWKNKPQTTQTLKIKEWDHTLNHQWKHTDVHVYI